MSAEYDRVLTAAGTVRECLLGSTKPDIAVVLGSGLGAVVASLEDAKYLPYGWIADFPVSTVPGHEGRFWLGRVSGKSVLAMQGRIHHYEGHSLADVVLPVRVMRALGVDTFIISNAAGGISDEYCVGDLVLIEDHLNMLWDSPLRGPHDERMGPRFVDMTRPYSPILRGLAKQAALHAGLGELKTGVYACMPGPQYETPAEVRMLRHMGATLVGMSTVPEVIALRHMGASVLGISCVTNEAAGIGDEVLSHEEVSATGAAVGGTFAKLLEAFIAELDRQAE